MNKYIIHDQAGNIVSCGMSSEEIDQRINESYTQVYVDFPDDIENYKYDISAGTIVRQQQSILDDRQSDLSWKMLREARDSRLTVSDWTQSADSPLTDTKKQEWATYRQALRDLPANTTDPANPTWPTQPS